jgi:hypothetical protein
LLAAFTENGPCLVPEKGADRGKAVFNPYAWNSNATVVWLDQPAGVGFSWGTENDKDEAGAAKDAYAFLQAFFKAHTALQALPFFVVGESYGGHYTPALTYAISQGNKVPGNPRINLKGVGVGNGLTVPLAQYPEYSTMAYNFTMEKLGKPVITLDVYKQMQAELKVCLPAIAACGNDTAVCALAQSICNNGQIGPYEATGLNPYDVRIPCEVPGLCYDESGVTAFFNEPAIQKALHVDSHATTWQTCNYNVNGQFSSDWMKQFAEPYISSQLEEGTRVLVSAPCARALARARACPSRCSLCLLPHPHTHPARRFTLATWTLSATGWATRPGRWAWSGPARLASMPQSSRTGLWGAPLRALPAPTAGLPSFACLTRATWCRKFSASQTSLPYGPCGHVGLQPLTLNHPPSPPTPSSPPYPAVLTSPPRRLRCSISSPLARHFRGAAAARCRCK